MTVTPDQLQAPTFAKDAGLSVDEGEVQFEDYFAFSKEEKFVFPDGKQYIEFRAMNEGEKKKFQDKTSRDLVVERTSGNARMTVLQGSERHELLRSCITGWYMFRKNQATEKWEPVPFDKRNLDEFLSKSNPVLIENLEKAVRRANPWLLDEMKVEDIDREIANLQEMREVAVRRQEGEGS